MKETVVAVVGVLTFIVAIMSALTTTLNYIDKNGCESYAETLGFEHKYSFSAGCILKTEQGWVGKNNYIIVKEEK